MKNDKPVSVITGGTGYVGLALVKYLVSRGENIRLFLLEDHPCLDGIACEKVYGNICNIRKTALRIWACIPTKPAGKGCFRATWVTATTTDISSSPAEKNA